MQLVERRFWQLQIHRQCRWLSKKRVDCVFVQYLEKYAVGQKCKKEPVVLVQTLSRETFLRGCHLSGAKPEKGLSHLSVICRQHI